MKSCSERVALARAGFTLVELLAVIAMAGLLAMMLIPTMAKTKPNSAAFQCQNNLRQLSFAWKMYADDNNGSLVYNRSGGVGKSLGSETWVGGWLDYTTSSDNTNAGLLIDHDNYAYCAFLGPYIKTPLAFKCPSDRSTASMAGGPMPRVRSVSMNNCVGTGSSTWPKFSVEFPLCSNLAQIKLPTYMFVVLDEREDSINDGCFSTAPETLYEIVDYPAGYHNNAGGFSFADGHAEIHHWKDRRTMPALQAGSPLTLNVNLPGDKDVLWLAQHAVGLLSYP